MGATLIRGNTQVMPATITADRFFAPLGLATSQLADGALFLKSDGSVAMTANLNFATFKGVNVGLPTSGSDLVPKSYVDAFVNGLTFKTAVRVVGTANVNVLTGTLLTIDGVTLNANDRVLLTGQTTASQNGLWTAQTGAWIRPSDWAAGAVEQGGVYVLSDPDGTTYKNTKWYLATPGPVTVDTTATAWSQDLSGTTYTNGNGISLTGTTFAAVGYATRLVTVDSNGIGITDGTPGQMIVASSSNHAAWVTASGDVTISSTGVHTVNNTSGTGFVKYGNFIDGETPSGALNGSNTTFTLASTPVAGSVKLYRNGVRQNVGAGNDYTISGTTITTATPPASTETLLADYRI